MDKYCKNLFNCGKLIHVTIDDKSTINCSMTIFKTFLMV